MLINFVNGGIGRAQLDHLGASLRDEPAIARASCGGQFCLKPRHTVNGFLHRFHQGARGCEKGQSTQCPIDFKFQVVLAQNICESLFQSSFGRLGAKAKVEVNGHFARNDIGGARSCLNIANLPAGGREKFIALIPHHAGQLGQRGCCTVNGVVGQLWIGNVSLYSFHNQLATELASATIFNHVASLFDGSGFANNAVVGCFLALMECFAYAHGAI